MDNKSPLAIVHSDAFLAHNALLETGITPKTGGNRLENIAGLLQALVTLHGIELENLVFPAFNYDFGSTGRFNPEQDPVQVGSIPEAIRKNQLIPRNKMPFFSFLSSKNEPANLGEILRPFGEKTTFSKIIDTDGEVIFFGVDLEFMTILHHIEERIGPPLYRYEKSFTGVVVTAEDELECRVEMHVRPRNLGLDYDWQKIERDLGALGAISHIGGSTRLRSVKAVDLLAYVTDVTRDDPFYLLNQATRDYLLSRGSDKFKRVRLSDFE